MAGRAPTREIPPRAEAGAERQRDRRIAWRLALVFFLFFALFLRGNLSGSDEVGLYHVTRSIVENGSLAVPQFHHTAPGVDGRRYSHFSIGQSLLAVPFFAAGRLAAATLPESAVRALAGETTRIDYARTGGSVEIFFLGLYGPAVGALLVALFFRFERELGASPRVAVLAAALLGASTYVAMMTSYFLRHLPESTAILGALLHFFRWRRDGAGRDLWIGSAFASVAFLIRFPAALVAPILAVYLAQGLLARSGGRPDARFLARTLPAILVPLAAALALSAGADFLRWGSPWNVHQFRTASVGGDPLYVTLYAVLLSPGMSVFVYSPLLLLAPFAFPWLWRRHRPEALVVLAIGGAHLLLYSSWAGWTGLWSAPGPRYHLIDTPLFLLPLGPWLEAARGRRRLLVAAALGAAGLAVQLVMMLVAWAPLVHAAGWQGYRPRWGFLFVPQHTPLVRALEFLPLGPGIDSWLWNLARGWPGQPPAPGAALAILAVWLVLLAAATLRLGRSLRT